MDNSASSFYDSLSRDYHLIYSNWDNSIDRQSEVLSSLIEDISTYKSRTILDCTCGIGTQSLGLSKRGYEVYGTDISRESIKRANIEAEKRDLQVNFDVVDLLELDEKVSGEFDVVISCDNSLPHLVLESELRRACKNILLKLKDHGLFIGSIRDYDEALQKRKKSTEIIKTIEDGNEIISFQVWDWNLDHTYIVSHFTLTGQGSKFETKLRKIKYKAYTRLELTNIFISAGFKKVEWLMPSETNYFQPIILGTKQ